MTDSHFDFVIVGSGFGGSVSALRLCEKGYRVLLLEKGRRFAAEDFPKSNWNLRRWLWAPAFDFRGLFKMTFLPHVTVFSGVGVGGGSLVYANTLPVPTPAFFASGSWAGLADWRRELEPHYATAQRMLGAARYPRVTPGDEVLREIAKDLGREDHFEATDVAVFFGEPGTRVPDPYFGGEGPDRTGCIHCGGCMTGCRFGAKNTLDQNYLWLAEKRGLTLLADTEVQAVRPRAEGGYSLEAVTSTGWLARDAKTFTADQVVLSGGVLGTVELLLRMKEDPRGLPGLSPRTGQYIRTNSESLIGVTSERRDLDLSTGVAITSILHTDEHSHVEPVRYSRGSGFFRLLGTPHATGPNAVVRLARSLGIMLRHPLRVLKFYLVPDWARYTQILLYMRTLDGTLTFRRGRTPLTLFRRGLTSALADAKAPEAFIPEATDIARRFAEKVRGMPGSIVTETVLGIPSTAHILGGACIGATWADGVIDAHHQVHGYPGLYVCDGSAMSANPGVNPSLSITAMSERAMSFVPRKGAPAAA
jgi:cholesterol oxidase